MRNASNPIMDDLFGFMPELREDEEKMKRLSVILSESIDAQQILAAAFHNNTLTPSELQERALKEHETSLSKIRTVIGHKRFYEIFGPEADRCDQLVDPEPFFKEFGR